MKRFLLILLALSLLSAASLADPLPLLDDYAGDIDEPYDENDPSWGTFRYSYRYPHVDEEAEGSIGINAFYRELIDYDLGFTVPIIQDAYEGYDSSTVITYTVTCNNDSCFSVLVRKEETNPDVTRTVWTGNVFLRDDPNPGFTSTLPHLLGTLSAGENDTWLQDRQTARADALIREMVWDMIRENDGGVEYNPGLTEELLSQVFFPEEDFYLDENGDPVFFLQPGSCAPAEFGLLTFPIALEDILDEM